MKQNLLLILFIFLTTTVFSQTSFSDRLAFNHTSEKVDVKIFPNPATDFIQISNNNNIQQVKIFNMVGKAVKNYDYIKGKNYYIGDLPKGIYLVQFSDKKSKVISTKRISKR